MMNTVKQHRIMHFFLSVVLVRKKVISNILEWDSESLEVVNNLHEGVAFCSNKGSFSDATEVDDSVALPYLDFRLRRSSLPDLPTE